MVGAPAGLYSTTSRASQNKKMRYQALGSEKCMIIALYCFCCSCQLEKKNFLKRGRSYFWNLRPIFTNLFNEGFLLPGLSRRLAPVLKCNAFLSFHSYIVRDISLTGIDRWLVTFGSVRWDISLVPLKSYPPFRKARGMEESQEKDYSFWERHVPQPLRCTSLWAKTWEWIFGETNLRAIA